MGKIHSLEEALQSRSEALDSAKGDKGSGKQADWRLTRHIQLSMRLFLFCLWGIVLVWGILIYRNRVENASQLLKQMNYAIEDQTRSQFRLVQTFLLAMDGWLVQNPESSVVGEPFFNSFAYSGKFRKETGLFVDFYAIDSEGNIYNLASDSQKVGHAPLGNVRDREYFQAVSGKRSSNIYIGAPTEGRVSGDWVIPVVLPLSTPRKGVEMLLVAIQLDILDALYEKQRIKPSGSLVLFRHDGTLLTRSPARGGFLGKRYPEDIEYFLQHEKYAPIWFSRSSFDGRAKLISYSVLEEFPIVMAVSVEYREILKGFGKNFAVFFVLAVIASVAILFAGRQQMYLQSEQTKLNAQVSRMATVDDLTGIWNRRRFVEFMNHEFARSRRYNTPLSLLMFDLDFFKNINDTYGHQKGDEVLVAFSTAVMQNLRSVDFFARFGGEEFVVLLPQTPIEMAKLLAERMCKIVHQLRVPTPQGEISFTTSVGVAALLSTDGNPEEMVHRADRSLYYAKSNGRNQVGSIEIKSAP